MLQNNTRFSFYALPEGAPPTGGFPLYIDFLPVNDVTHNTSEVRVEPEPLANALLAWHCEQVNTTLRA